MKISELNPTEVLNDEDIFPVVQDGETKNVKRKNLFKHLPTPIEDNDAVPKKWVEEKIKENEAPVDDTLDENSKNAISNSAVAKEFRDFKKTWYVMDIKKFATSPCSIKANIKTESKIGDDGQTIYSLIANFSFYAFAQETVDNGYIHIPLTNIPFEIKPTEDRYFISWINSDKFHSFGIIHPLMGTEPLDLIKNVENLIDGSVFYDFDASMSIGGFTAGYFDFDCIVAIHSRSELAINTLAEELTPMLTTATHLCIAYQNYGTVEVERTEEG